VNLFKGFATCNVRFLNNDDMVLTSQLEACLDKVQCTRVYVTIGEWQEATQGYKNVYIGLHRQRESSVL
jgi:hypothetical protein